MIAVLAFIALFLPAIFAGPVIPDGQIYTVQLIREFDGGNVECEISQQMLFGTPVTGLTYSLWHFNSEAPFATVEVDITDGQYTDPIDTSITHFWSAMTVVNNEESGNAQFLPGDGINGAGYGLDMWIQMVQLQDMQIVEAHVYMYNGSDLYSDSVGHPVVVENYFIWENGTENVNNKGITSIVIDVSFVSVAPVVPGRPAYICEVLYENFCPENEECPSDPTITFGESTYGFEHFNLISFDSLFASSGDVEGRVAVRNNFDVSTFSVGYQLITGGVSAQDISLPYSVVVGNDAKWHGGSVHPDGSGVPYIGDKEFIFVGGDFSDADDYLKTERTGFCTSSGCLNADFDNAQAYYRMLSQSFGSLSNNADFQIASGGTFSMTCNSYADSQYIISISPNDFSSITSWTFDDSCNPESSFVVNIAGSGITVKFAGATQTFFANQRTLYNVIPQDETTPSVRVEVSVNGNLLAPSSQYNQPGMGVFIGQVIVANVAQVLQVNLIYCQPPPVPNPNNSSYLCPSFETNCEGLDIELNGEFYSFRDFNAISFGNFYADTGDIQGRLAVRNDAYFGFGYSVGYELQTATGQPDRELPFSLVVGRDLFWGSGALYPEGNGIPYPGDREDMFVGGIFTTNQTDLLFRRTGGACVETSGCYDSTFDAARQCYRGYQSAIASQSDNVAKQIEFSGLSITCNDASASTYYVSLTQAEMNSFTYTTIGNCNFQAYWFINIRGSDNVEITGASFPGVPGGIVYNIIGAEREIHVHDTEVTGHLLAPDNTLKQSNGLITGKVVAGDITASLQINKQNTCPERVDVDIPVVVASDDGVSSFITFTNDEPVVGDRIDGVTILERIGDNTYSLSAPLNAHQGDVKYIETNSFASRTPSEIKTEQPSSASIISVALTAVVALILIAF